MSDKIEDGETVRLHSSTVTELTRDDETDNVEGYWIEQFDDKMFLLESEVRELARRAGLINNE